MRSDLTSSTAVVLLCGGSGLRMRTESDGTAKPLLRLADGRPLLTHVMDSYRRSGFTDFVLCLGYGAASVRSYLLTQTVTSPVCLTIGPGTVVGRSDDSVRVALLDTGTDSTKVARLRQVKAFTGNRTFLFGYGDVLSDLNLNEVLSYHRSGTCAVTVVGTRPISPYGHIETSDGRTVTGFIEKPRYAALISAGFFVADQKIFDYLDTDAELESDVLPRMAADKEMQVFEHDGFWHPVDTRKDLLAVDEMIRGGRAPWLSTT